ncbi:MFS transporter [Actinomadura sp. 7K507]|uniref:MFS transporter n=1 Tax=Actinomadura sp. 7K507 TaxID=2530365 RepID=UPI00104B9DED|nr:MFS transporter [Actinomadura sp. 7K507]TDC85872.1 MFS transporter [Actinomadura sp. 7K507]
MGSSTRRWAGLAVLALPTLLLSLDISVLYLALPHLNADLGASGTQQLWIMDVYTFMLAGFLMTMGTLGDRIGRRRLLLVGAFAFGAASVAAAYSTGPEQLIAARALMGVAGATLMPSTLALIGTLFTDARSRGTAIAIWASCMMVGAALGPVVGGLVLQEFWWGSVFLMGVPVMALLLAVGPVLLPESRTGGAGRIDLASVALSLATILPAVYGLKELAREGWQPLPVAAMAAAAGFGALFVRRQRRLDDPLLDLRLFANRSFSAALSITLLGGIPLSGVFLLVSQQLQLVEGHSPTKAGLWLAPVGLSVAVSAMAAPALAQRMRPGTVIAVGMTMSAAGFLILAHGLLVPGVILIYLGIGPSVALCPDLIVRSAPAKRAGSAASLSESATELSVALGITIMGSLGAAVYRARVEAPPAVGDAAHESLAHAVAEAGRLPADMAAPLLDSARDAFMAGLDVVAVVGAVIFVVTAAVAAAALHSVPTVDGGQEPLGGGTGSVPEDHPEHAT